MRKPSGAAKTALLVCPEVPFPAVGGGALRTASLATYLGAHYALDLILFREPGATVTVPEGLARDVLVIDLPRHRKDPVTKAFRNLHRLLRFIPPHEDRFRGHEPVIDAWLGDRSYDFVCLEHFWTSTYAPLLRPRAKRLALDLHNIESVAYESRARAEPAMAPLWRRFAAANRVREKARLPDFDMLLVTSPEDAARVNLPGTLVYPNAVPWVAAPDVDKQQAIAFSGNLEFPPNITAVKWFAREVWPELARRHPDLEWRIIGKGPEFVRALVDGLPRVRLTGPVDDAIRDLAMARVAVVPILSGSGTRLKILEAWAARTAVVSTSLGAEGLGCDGCLALANSSAEFIDRVGMMLTAEMECAQVASRGRGVYEERFTWPAAWSSLESNGI
jgi:hypothetical protein